MQPAVVHRSHRAGEHGGHDDRALVARREGAQRAEHAAVEGQWRVRIDVAEQDAVGVDEVLSEQDAGHAHGVRSMARRLGRALAALVAVTEECVLDVEMALAFGYVHRLDHAAAGKMDRRRDVGELDEVVQVRERAVAAAAVEVRHEGRPADRREDRRVPAEAHAARRVPRVQRELAWSRAQQLAGEAARNPDAFAVHVGPCLAPQPQRFRVAPELDADLFEDRLGIGLDDLHGLAVQQLDGGNAAADVRELLGHAVRTRRTPRFAIAGAAGAVDRGRVAQGRARVRVRPAAVVR